MSLGLMTLGLTLGLQDINPRLRLVIDFRIKHGTHSGTHHRKGTDMTALTATDARKGFFKLIQNASEQHEIYHIRHRSGNTVLMSEDEYDSLNESLALLSSPGFRDAFEKSRREEATGDTVSFEDVFRETQ